MGIEVVKMSIIPRRYALGVYFPPTVASLYVVSLPVLGSAEHVISKSFLEIAVAALVSVL